MIPRQANPEHQRNFQIEGYEDIGWQNGWSPIFRFDKHSKKPVYFRQWINEAYPEQSKLELFARKPSLLFDAEGYDGWDVWGNEVESDIDI